MAEDVASPKALNQLCHHCMEIKKHAHSYSLILVNQSIKSTMSVYNWYYLQTLLKTLLNYTLIIIFTKVGLWYYGARLSTVNRLLILLKTANRKKVISDKLLNRSYRIQQEDHTLSIYIYYS